MRVLVIEDSARLRNYMSKGLRAEGYAVDVAEDGEEGLYLTREHGYDAIILDLMLPKVSGMEILSTLRAEGNDTHVLILSAKDTVPDRIAGLERGADDYLIKPFAFDELVARVRTLTRRAYGAKKSTIEIGNLVINLSSREVFCDGALVDLRPREFALLELLALRRGEVVSRVEIEERIYDEVAEPSSNVVESAISVLRKRIGSKGETSLIRTRRGMGYILEVPGA